MEKNPSGTKHIPVNSKLVGLREDLAKYVHGFWCRYMEYIFDHADDPGDGSLEINYLDATRWKRRVKVGYDKILPDERDIYRDEADRIIDVFKKHMV